LVHSLNRLFSEKYFLLKYAQKVDEETIISLKYIRPDKHALSIYICMQARHLKTRFSIIYVYINKCYICV